MNLPKEGEQVGPYRLIRELGHGGQGIVWLADDSRLPRQVALKTLTFPSRTDPDVLSSHIRTFHEEAQVTSRLDHPGICAVIDSGVSDSTAYIAMRYVRGHTLKQWRGAALPRGSSEVRRILSVFEQIAHALHAAHEAGVVHRDIKPQNIMIMPNGAPVILDFGLARLVETSGFIPAGELFEGTAKYMSPEQIAPERVKLDRRSDVYSLGVTLYECLTNRRPFETQGAELYLSIMARRPDAVRKLNKRLPPELGAVLEKALAKHPDGRYASAKDLADDLGRIQRFEVTRGVRTPVYVRPLRWLQRRPLAAAAGGVIAVLAALLIGALSLWQGSQRELKRERASRMLEAARAETGRDPALALRLLQEASSLAPALTEIGNASAEIVMALRGKRVLIGHEGAIADAAFSRDGRILTGSLDGTARTWNSDTGDPLDTLTIPAPDSETICAVGWRGPTPLVVTQTNDLQVHVRSLPTAEKSAPARHESRLSAACLSSNGVFLATLADGTARLREIGDDRSSVLREKNERAIAIGFSSDDAHVFTIGDDGRIRIWSVRTPGDPTIVTSESGKAWRVALGPASGSELFLAAATYRVEASDEGDSRPARFIGSNTVEVNNLVAKSRRTIGSHSSGVSSMAWGRHGLLLTAGRDSTTLWDTSRSTYLDVAELRHESPSRVAKFSHDGSLALAGLEDGRTIVWRIDQLERQPAHGAPLVYDQASGRVFAIDVLGPSGEPIEETHVTVSRDGRRVLTTIAEPFEIIDTDSGRQVAVVPRTASATVFAADGEYLVATGATGSATIYRSRPLGRQPKEAQEIAPIQTRSGHRVTARFSPVGHRLLTYARDDDVVLWDLDGGPSSRPLCSAKENVSVAAFTSDGRRVLTMPRWDRQSTPDSRPVPRLWSVAQERPPFALEEPSPGDPHTRSLLAFSPDGSTAAIASEREICIHDCSDGRIVSRLAARDACRAEFDERGLRLMAVLTNDSARVWSWRDRRVLLDVPCPEGTIACFGGEGDSLVIASKQNIRVWNTATARETWCLSERVSGLGLTPDRRWMLARVSSCSDSFKSIPVDPMRQAATVVCRQFTVEECDLHHVEGSARSRAAQLASQRRTVGLR